MRNKSVLRSAFTALAISIVTAAGYDSVSLHAQANHPDGQAMVGAQNERRSPQVSPEQIRARFGTQVQQQGWNSPRVPNPKASEADSSIIAVLRQQQQAAETEKAQIMAAMNRKAQPPDSVARPAGPNAPMAPSRTQSSNSGPSTMNLPSSAPSGIKTAEVPVSSAICPPGTQPVLRTVDGRKSGVIFTPAIAFGKMAPANPTSFFYTIEGCHFGDITGHVALTGAFSKGKIDLAVDTWTDSGIVVHVPAEVSGELDQDNATLVLTISGIALQAPGFKFYAAREEILLSFVPVREAALGGPKLRANFPFFQSPGFGTFDVQRNTDTSFVPGTDYYSFDGLQRGFMPVAFQASRYAPLTADQCNYMVNLNGMQISFDGQWNAQWDGSRLRVDWPVAHCYAPGYNEWAAWYGTKVWVSGPRGIDPWVSGFRLAPTPVTVPNPHGF